MTDRIAALLFPRKCVACGNLLDWYDAPKHGDVLCASCLAKWKNERLRTCERCAKVLSDCICMPDALRKSKCRSLGKAVYYRQGKHDTVQNRLIYRIKDTRDKHTVDFLARALLPILERTLSENAPVTDGAVLTYLPRSMGAKLGTGTDQARELARALSRLSGVPCKKLLRRRVWKGRAQKRLGANERRANASASFRLCRAAREIPRAVILVDDIVTTGESMAACVRLLRTAGAEAVFALSVAVDE